MILQNWLVTLVWKDTSYVAHKMSIPVYGPTEASAIVFAFQKIPAADKNSWLVLETEAIGRVRS